MRLSKLVLGMLAIGMSLGVTSTYGQGKAIDVNRSSMKIRVFKSGAFSAFAHDHEIEAPIAEGKIDASGNPSVQLRVESGKMRVLDPEIAAGKRAEIQHTTAKRNGSRCREGSRDFLPIDSREQPRARSLGSARGSDPSRQETAHRDRGVVRERTLSRFRNGQAKRFRHRAYSHCGRDRKGEG